MSRTIFYNEILEILETRHTPWHTPSNPCDANWFPCFKETRHESSSSSAMQTSNHPRINNCIQMSASISFFLSWLLWTPVGVLIFAWHTAWRVLAYRGQTIRSHLIQVRPCLQLRVDHREVCTLARNVYEMMWILGFIKCMKRIDKRSHRYECCAASHYRHKRWNRELTLKCKF